MKRSKRSFTLLEMMLSLSLLGLLLGTFFFWSHRNAQAKSALFHKRQSVYQERYLDQRLSAIFLGATLEKEGFFTSDHTSCLFTFDRGAYPVPALSHQVIGKLYHNPRSEGLYLSIWSLSAPSGDPAETYLLMDKVEKVSFTFYSPPDLLKLAVSTDKVGTKKAAPGWKNHVWEKEYETLPAMVKLSLERSCKKAISSEYTIDLDHPIFYPLEAS